MSFFKKSSNKSEKKQPPAGGGYPSQSPYPTQSAYPTQPSAPSYPPGVAPGEQPPAYTPQGQQLPPQHVPQGAAQRPAYYPQQPQYAAPPGGMYYPMSGAGVYPMHPQIPPGANVVGHGTFDAGARFNSGASVNIPPPPPGAMPTAAQIAAAHGGTVTMGQAKSGVFSGGSDGGVTTHID